jgi:hypothetical protein
MSLVCKTLVFIQNPETLKLVAQAFPHPKYELDFADNIEEASAHAVSSRMDLFIVDSRFAEDEKVDTIRRCVPTLFVEPEYTQAEDEECSPGEESDRMRNAAEKLLRKNYISWIVDALEYSS